MPGVTAEISLFITFNPLPSQDVPNPRTALFFMVMSAPLLTVTRTSWVGSYGKVFFFFLVFLIEVLESILLSAIS